MVDWLLVTSLTRGETMGSDESILILERVKKYFPLSLGLRGKKLYVRAVDDVSLTIRKGETIALVGESGSGKTTLGRIIAGLLPPDEGRVIYRGIDLYNGNVLSKNKELRFKIQAIFQNPDTSLNPRMMIYDTLAEAIRVRNNGLTEEEVAEKAAVLLENVGLNLDHLTKYPHELSGGEKQRVAIARALAMNPEVLIADEIVSALDVSVRAQVLNVLIDVKDKYDLTIVFITHDMGLVWSISDKIAVMYLGRIVEYGDTESVFRRPLHPYTRMLLTSSPTASLIGYYRNDKYKARGEPPSPVNPPKGCRFNTRCPIARDKCFEEDPPLSELVKNRWVACHRALEED
jgi:oligopeptide/dipeptide ABC transporter ATP-binding protein